MKYIKLTNFEQKYPVIKSVIIKKDDVESVKDYETHRIVTVKTSSGTSQWVVSETIDEIYDFLHVLYVGSRDW